MPVMKGDGLMAQYISDDKKQAIIQAIRDEGKRVVEVAAAHNVSTKSIYTWLRDGVKGDNSALEIARLKRETEMLYGLLGKLTAEASRSKK
jgi:transposase-like protein